MYLLKIRKISLGIITDYHINFYIINRKKLMRYKVIYIIIFISWIIAYEVSEIL